MTSEQNEKDENKSADNQNKIMAICLGIILAVGVGWYVYSQEFFGENAPTTPESIAADRVSCIEAIKTLTDFPEKSDFLPDTLVLGHDAERSIEGRVELADEKGNMYRHLFKCTVTNGTVTAKEAVRG